LACSWFQGPGSHFNGYRVAAQRQSLRHYKKSREEYKKSREKASQREVARRVSFAIRSRTTILLFFFSSKRLPDTTMAQYEVAINRWSINHTFCDEVPFPISGRVLPLISSHMLIYDTIVLLIFPSIESVV